MSNLEIRQRATRATGLTETATDLGESAQLHAAN